MMKDLKDIIQEKLIINKHSKCKPSFYPKDKNELKKLIDKLIKDRGNKVDLNDINTSEIIDMSELFQASNFDGDISKWDVSHVENMALMFADSKFTGENGDISNWDVSNVKSMRRMFIDSSFNGDISQWDVSKVEDMHSMFENSIFTCENGDISKWDVSNVKDMDFMFTFSPLEKNPPSWYKYK